MSTVPIFQQLLLDNTELFTSKGLSALLEDCLYLKYTLITQTPVDGLG